MKKFLFVLCALLLSATVLPQSSFTFKEAKVKFDVPAGWKMVTEDNSVYATDANESFVVYFELLEDAEIDETTIEEITRELENDFDNVEIEAADKIEKQNGLEYLMYAGRLTDAEKNQLVLVGAFFETPSKHILSVALCGEQAGIEENDEELEFLLDSIRPIKK